MRSGVKARTGPLRVKGMVNWLIGHYVINWAMRITDWRPPQGLEGFCEEVPKKAP